MQSYLFSCCNLSDLSTIYLREIEHSRQCGEKIRKTQFIIFYTAYIVTNFDKSIHK